MSPFDLIEVPGSGTEQVMRELGGEALLVELLGRNAPAAHWIHGLLLRVLGDQSLGPELPTPAGSAVDYSAVVVPALFRRGLVDPPLLDALERALPHESSAVNDIRRTLNIPMHVEMPVGFDMLTDNWIYQDIAELFSQGPREGVRGLVTVGHDELKWSTADWCGIALESLLTVLGAIVLRDRMLVEQNYVEAWISESSPVLGLHAGGILCPIPDPDGLPQVRSRYYREIFHVPALQRWHKDQVAAMRTSPEAASGYGSAVLWGSVGYLARGALLNVTYVGHPVRRRFLAQSGLVRSDGDAAARTFTTIDAVRGRYLAVLEDTATRLLRLVVPPLLVEIIENASTPEDLVLAALQLREEYRPLRQWLAQFQRALDTGNREYVLECESMLAGVKKTCETFGSQRHEVASRTIHTEAGLHRPAAIILERLARTRAGDAAIDRLLDMFDISGTVLETPVLTHLRTEVMES